MKNLLAILTILVAFASCSDRAGGWRPAPELRTAHELMQERPDSALKVLIGFDIGDSTSRSVVNEYQILVAEALYKNDCAQTNAPAVIDATAYYDSVFEKYPENSDLAFETARAHYYKAVGATEKDDIVAACADYLKAADIMEAAFPEIAKAARKGMMGDDYYKKNKFVSLIYNRIGNLMYAECYYEGAVDNYKTALNYAKWIDDSKFVAILLKHIGNSYNLGNMPDSALYYYRHALNVGGEYENLRCGINITTASIYYEKGLVDSAYLLLKKNLSSPDDFILAQTYYTIGELFFKDMMFDSASYYLKPCFECGGKLMKLSSAKMLAEIYDNTGYKELSAFYNKHVSENAIDEINRRVKTKSLIDLYNNNKNYKNIQKNKYRVLLYSIIAVFVTIIVFFTRSIIHRRQKIQISNDANWRISVANGKLKTARQKINEQQDKIKTREREIDVMHRSSSILLTGNCLDSYRTHKICVKIISRIRQLDEKGIKRTELEPLTSSELSELRRAADTCLVGFTNMMTTKYSKLNVDDLNFLCLCLLDIPYSSMPALLGKSRSTIWNRAKKIASIMDIKPNETIVQVLMTMI